MPPLVSICLPTLNARRFLEPRMDSILAQTLTDWELIICDSFSDDGTWEYFQQFKDDPRVRLYQVPKEGLYAGWNECLKRCRGEYVYIATADDTCVPECLERMVGALQAAQTTDYRLQTADSLGQIADHRLQTADSLDRRTEDGGQRSEVRGQRTEVRGRRSEVGGQSSVNSHQSSLPGLQSAVCGQQSDPKSLQSAVCGLQSGAKRHLDLAVCDFDFIDDKGAVIAPPREVAGGFYGDWLRKPHLRSGLLEYLVHGCISVSWVTMTSVIFRRTLLEQGAYFRTDAGLYGDLLWAMFVALRSDTVYVPEKLATWRFHPEQSSLHFSRREHRLLMRAAEKELNRDANLIPCEWKLQSDWQDALLWGIRRRYWDSFGLNRFMIRRHPWLFLKGCGCALLHEPRFLMRRLARGFDWEDEMLEDSKVYLKRFMEKFGVPEPVEMQF